MPAKSIFKAYVRKDEIKVAELNEDLLNLIQTGGANASAKVGDLLVKSTDASGKTTQEVVTAEDFAKSTYKPKFAGNKGKKVATQSVEVPQASEATAQA